MSTSPALTHDAMIYRDDGEFVTALVPFVLAGLDQDHAVAAAVSRPNMTLLRDALGADAERVAFLDRDEWYVRPASTMAGWQRLLSDASGRGYRHTRLIGEAGDRGTRLPCWTRYEAAVNEVFAQAPASIVCPYDARVLSAATLDDARRTHPTVMGHAERCNSDRYLPTDKLLRVVPEPVPLVSGAPAIVMELTDSVACARRAVAALTAAHGWAGHSRSDELALVVSEITANSIVHGRGRRELRVWLHGRTVTCEVSDEGAGLTDPLAGLRPPPLMMAGGRGLWIARQLCDALAIGRRDGSTVVRFAVTLPG